MNCHFTTKKKYPKHFEEPEMGCAATVGVKVDKQGGWKEKKQLMDRAKTMSTEEERF